MDKQIKLLKNNLGRDWSDLQWVEEFYEFLQGKIPDGISLINGHVPRLTPKVANTIIWYLQEHLPVFPDKIEQCSKCKDLYDSWAQGHYSELTGRCYCGEGCEPHGLYEKEQRAEMRADAPFRKWLKQVKKEQKKYPALKGKDINDALLREHFQAGESPIDALNDIITLT